MLARQYWHRKLESIHQIQKVKSSTGWASSEPHQKLAPVLKHSGIHTHCVTH